MGAKGDDDEAAAAGDEIGRQRRRAGAVAVVLLKARVCGSIASPVGSRKEMREMPPVAAWRGECAGEVGVGTAGSGRAREGRRWQRV